MYDVNKIRQDFPIFSQSINGCPNTFLDTAASAQKPLCVIERIKEVYMHEYANVHRGSYKLSEDITFAYDNARKSIQKFINAKHSHEVVFTRNATEGINLVVSTWARHNLKPGDEVLISQAEHNANLVPWQVLRDEIGFTLKIFKITDEGLYEEQLLDKELTDKTKFISVTACSNVLGSIFPIKEICQKAHKVGAKCLVDACQYAVHHQIDVQDIDCDFLAFSGHKLYGPTGIGVLYGKAELLDSMPPYQYGGDMVKDVSYTHSVFNDLPYKFEAGTPNFVGAVGLAEAIKYINSLGWKNIVSHEEDICRYMWQSLQEIQGLHLVSTTKHPTCLFSFEIDGVHHHDLAFILDKQGVSIRVGHHCAKAVVNRMGYEGVARASIGLYTNKEDIDRFVAALKKAKNFF